MKVADVMHEGAVWCRGDESLEQAARLFWEHDCGALPVVDSGGQVVAMITDRDTLMAAYTQGKRLDDVPVSIAMSRTLHACRAEDSLASAEKTMQKEQVRRLPVVDVAGRLVGMLTLADIARAVETGRHGKGVSPERVVDTVAAVTAPHAHAIAAE